MAAAVVEARGLRKTYHSRTRRSPLRAVARPALAGLDLVVPGGGVHGFLGPNGSGKTTTLRVLLGLVRADAGEVEVLGEPVPAGLARTAPYVGALVETPAVFPGFSGRRNLSLLAGVAGLASGRVDEVLELVDLTERADERVKGYSLGMRQRLGIAAALLKRPRLLVLDEPTNGLDPAGMRDVRLLVRRLAGEGVTVLLSSHLLSEVAQVCDSVTIVARGCTVAAGPVDQVLDRGSGERRWLIGVDDPVAGLAVLSAAGVQAQVRDGRLVARGVNEPARLTRLLGEQGLWLHELREDAAALEDVFLALTEDGVAG